MIPFNRPAHIGPEFDYIQQAIREHQHLSGDGHFSGACHAFLEQHTGADKALLTPSCTDALEMCAILLDLQPGDEVILPAFTFVSTANAFVLHGAKPVFVDIRPDTLNIDENHIEAAITSRTRAIVVVHYAGVACQMETILALAARHGVTVIEDNAHGLFGAYQGRPLGGWGALATLSFHETKNVTCGEGGALLINDTALIERAEIIRDKGTNRRKFFRGQVDKYTWVDKGASFLLSDLNAAYLYAQLEHWQTIQHKRAAIWQRYADGLRAWAEARGVGLPQVPPDCDQAYHMFYVLLPQPDQQTAFIRFLAEQGVNAVFHYQPLNRSAMGQQFGAAACRVTESVSARLVRLPFFYGLGEAEQATVIEHVRAF